MHAITTSKRNEKAHVHLKRTSGAGGPEPRARGAPLPSGAWVGGWVVAPLLIALSLTSTPFPLPSSFHLPDPSPSSPPSPPQLRDLNLITSQTVFIGPYLPTAAAGEEFCHNYLLMTEGFLSFPLAVPGSGLWNAVRARHKVLVVAVMALLFCI